MEWLEEPHAGHNQSQCFLTAVACHLPDPGVSNAQKKASVNRQQMRSNYNRHQSNYGGSLHTSVRGSVYGGDNESSMPLAQSV